MDKKELILLVERIVAAKGTEQELDEMLELFLANVPDPHASDYIFGKEYEALSPEEIVDKALSYKPFIL